MRVSESFCLSSLNKEHCFSDRILSSLYNYFYFGGKRIEIISRSENQDIICSSNQGRPVPLAEKIVKILSYFLLFPIVLTVLLVRLLLHRAIHNHKIVLLDSQDPGAACATHFKNAIKTEIGKASQFAASFLGGSVSNIEDVQGGVMTHLKNFMNIKTSDTQQDFFTPFVGTSSQDGVLQNTRPQPTTHQTPLTSQPQITAQSRINKLRSILPKEWAKNPEKIKAPLFKSHPEQASLSPQAKERLVRKFLKFLSGKNVLNYQGRQLVYFCHLEYFFLVKGEEDMLKRYTKCGALFYKPNNTQEKCLGESLMDQLVDLGIFTEYTNTEYMVSGYFD
ncbi:hypothetical protein [Chlamydia felis Fe/C-56]|uniref:Uncharacterized protein n=1 Tax=Chlamydia felis (strain Fe/C-56) TaxID=264202 RepID=Q254R3_CHLFF|nr:DUF648 domain-containing protein [Chlamydia felis]BAE81225.1 hypothetical protein [Chlamydia felis Fe/C-56]